jgi:hypothetical protein
MKLIKILPPPVMLSDEEPMAAGGWQDIKKSEMRIH